MQRHFPGSLILKEEDFINLNVKYGLVVGRLSAYKGSVPDENKEIKKWQKVNSSETKAQLFEAVDYICADEPNGLVGVTGLLFDADKLKRTINAALSMRAEANVVTRRYGLRQQVLYLMYYGEE